MDTQEEPDPRQGQIPSKLKGTLTISGMVAGKSYTLYRYDGTAAVPTDGTHNPANVKATLTAGPNGVTTYKDEVDIFSDSSVYYFAV